jgi:hypothetical protein
MNQATAARVTGSGDMAEMRRMAGQLEEENPSWIVVFGVYTREFVAFPRFDVPRGTVIAARYPHALPPRMRRIEAKGTPGPRDRASETQPGDGAAAAPQPGE